MKDSRFFCGSVIAVLPLLCVLGGAALGAPIEARDAMGEATAVEDGGMETREKDAARLEELRLKLEKTQAELEALRRELREELSAEQGRGEEAGGADAAGGDKPSKARYRYDGDMSSLGDREDGGGHGKGGDEQGDEEEVGSVSGTSSSEARGRAARNPKGNIILDSSEEGGGDGDRVVMGSDTVIEAGDVVDDLVVIMGSAEVAGHVRGDAVAVGGGLHLQSSSVVDGDVVSIGGSIEMEEGARVRGERVVIAGSLSGLDIQTDVEEKMKEGDDERDSNRSEGVGIGVRQADDDSEIGDDSGWFGGIIDRLKRSVVTWLLLFPCSILLLGLAPERVARIEDLIEEEGGRSFLAGIFGAFFFVIATIGLAVILIGIPLIPVLYFGAILAIVAGATAIAFLVGRRIPMGSAPPRSPGGAVLWGLAMLSLLIHLPYIGWLIGLLVIIPGFGAAILSLFDREVVSL